MIGTTRSANVNFRLEKRVLSRLNAQFVYIAPSSAREICGALSQHLSLPSASEKERSCLFRRRFNAEVERTFGPRPRRSDLLFSLDSAYSVISEAGEERIDLHLIREEDNEDRESGDRKRGADEISVGTVYDDVLQCVENGTSLK